MTQAWLASIVKRMRSPGLRPCILAWRLAGEKLNFIFAPSPCGNAVDADYTRIDQGFETICKADLGENVCRV